MRVSPNSLRSASASSCRAFAHVPTSVPELDERESPACPRRWIPVTVRLAAIRAIHFVHAAFTSRATWMRGQAAHEVRSRAAPPQLSSTPGRWGAPSRGLRYGLQVPLMLTQIPARCADDDVINCCIFHMQAGRAVVLLSADRLLRCKAMVYGVCCSDAAKLARDSGAAHVLKMLPDLRAISSASVA